MENHKHVILHPHGESSLRVNAMAYPNRKKKKKTQAAETNTGWDLPLLTFAQPGFIIAPHGHFDAEGNLSPWGLRKTEGARRSSPNSDAQWPSGKNNICFLVG